MHERDGTRGGSKPSPPFVVTGQSNTESQSHGKKKKGKGKKRRLQLDNLTCKPHNTHHQPSLFSIHTKPREVCPDNKSSAPFLINPHPPSPPPFLEERREGRCEFWGCGGAGKRQPGNQDPKKLRTITLGLAFSTCKI